MSITKVLLQPIFSQNKPVFTT